MPAARQKYLTPRDAIQELQQAGALQQTGALQSAIFNSVNFSSIATDAEGVIQIFNVGAERMLGYTAAEVTNKMTPADISDPREIVARSKALSAELGTAIAPGFEALVFKASRAIEDIYELTYIRKDGTRFPAVVSVTALRDSQRTIIGYLLIGTDNTARQQVEEERKKLEQALQRKNVELQAASRMKSEFLANMSHELRTPLNAIIGFSELLRDGLIGDLTTKQRGFIDDIFGSGTHLLSLINDILDLSKVEAGKMTLDLETVDLSSLFANTLSIVKEKAASRRINLSMHIDDDLGPIQADARKVKQIVYNLLSNAVKFSADGGQVVLRATRSSRANVGKPSGSWAGRSLPLPTDEANPFADFLEISVTDSGIGISEDGLEQLFKPFSQIDGGLARKFEGTGLGLAMVKLLSELHCGTVAVESAVGQGSRFRVWLPMREPAAGHTLPARSSGPRQSAPPIGGIPAVVVANLTTVLVIEDNSANLMFVTFLLESAGHTVLAASDAEAGLTLARDRQPKLILMDIQLPGIDGLEATAMLKRDPVTRDIPVIALTAFAMKGDEERILAAGFDGYIAKPMRYKDFLREISARLGPS